MRIRIISLLTCILVLGFSTLRAESNPYSENSVLHQIENDYLSGNISLNDKVLLQVNSIKQPNKTPLRYMSVSQATSEHELREATLALIEMRSVWDQLDQSTQSSIAAALARVSTEFTFVSPNGYFKLHYDTAGIDAVPLLDTDNNLIPDFVEQCASYCDTSLAKHLEIGFVYPPSDGVLGGDSLYDVYFQSMTYYGYAVPEGLGSNPWNDYFSHLVLNNDFIGFPANTDPEGQIAGAAKATAVHEFHHAIQFGYNAFEEVWAMEAGATFLEEVAFDHVNDNYNYLDDFLGFPHTSLMDNGGLHKYGAFIFPLYIAQKFDTLLYVAAWEGARYSDFFTSLADTLLANFGWDIDSAYVDFTYWMYNTASFDDGAHFTEASLYYPVAVSVSHISYPVGLTNSMASVGGYGSEYITFYPGSETGKLKLTFNGSDSRNWSSYVIKSTTQNSHEIEFITLDSINQIGEILIEDFQNYYSVTLVGVNTDEYSSSVLFTYSAEILPFEVSALIIAPVDPFIYSGGVRTIEILVVNIAEVNDIFNLIYWDENGWLPMDTFSFAVEAGGSKVVYVDVTPPQGTPLETTSLLSFKAESWGDPTVIDLQTKTGEISLFRGDVNFSGEIDIADLVMLVDYAFTGGPPPLPIILSADIECSGEYDISDLVFMVEFMFNDGPSSPCNPY